MTKPQQTGATLLSAPASICSSRCACEWTVEIFWFFLLLPSVSPDFCAPSLERPVLQRGWGQWGRGRVGRMYESDSEGARSVLIIGVGSADVPSSLSARILPLALFSVSFFNITCSAPPLVGLFFSLSVCLVRPRRQSSF